MKISKIKTFDSVRDFTCTKIFLVTNFVIDENIKTNYIGTRTEFRFYDSKSLLLISQNEFEGLFQELFSDFDKDIFWLKGFYS